LSARYSVVPDEFFIPDEYRAQSRVNKQSSEGSVAVSSDSQRESAHQAFHVYKELLDAGVCREQARCHLPQSTYTEFYWKVNLHNLMGYLHLRMDSGAQQEIQAYARAMFDIVKPLAPFTMEAFVDFRVESLTLSGPEVRAFVSGRLENPSEDREFQEKRKRLGFLQNNE